MEKFKMKMLKLCTIILCISLIVNAEEKEGNKNITSYNPEELLAKIFNPTEARQGGYGLIKFDNQKTDGFPQGPVVPFPQDQFNDPYKQGNKVAFQDDNQIGGQIGQKKKRKRRRKPKNHGYGFGPTFPGFYGGQDPNVYQQYPGGGVPQGFPSGQNPYFNTGYPQDQFYRPTSRPKPSFTSEALSSITRALTSIALYDDYQCVPRLLCEAASGGALGTAGFLQSAAGLQPLLTLLAAYNGISSSPLFIFGRAVFLGMTSKSNPGTCRYAYSQCPNDPEQLVHYLNNHNGGFFRFFNAPQGSPQNLQQFYNELSLQQNGNYGLLDNQDPNGYGLYQNHHLPLMNQQHQYGFQNPNFAQYHVNRYPHQNGIQKANEKNKLEKRIQNNPHSDDQEKLAFPDEYNYDVGEEIFKNSKKGKGLRFPESTAQNQNIIDNFNDIRESGIKFPTTIENEDVNNKRKPKTIFPESESNRQYINYYNYPPLINYNNFRQDRDVKNKEEGVELVYVIRGNGDPNNPEVIKLRPGQKIV